MRKFVNNLLPGWSFEENYAFLELGKIWLLWHPSVKVLILSKSLQQITCEVKLPEANQPFVASIIMERIVQTQDQLYGWSLWS